MPELEERRPEGEVATIVPYLSIHEIAERLGVSAEAAYALVKATLGG
jgi:transposase